MVSIENHSQKVDNTLISRDAQLDSIISPYKRIFDSKMNDTLAYSPKEISKERYESELGNWVADGMKWYIDSVMKLKSDIAFCNYGGLRIKSLPKGAIQLKHIFELMPFENALVVVELDSNELKRFLHNVIYKDGWPVSKGFYMHISNENKLIDWSVQKQRKNNYRVILSDYVANGGDNMDMLISKKKEETNVIIRDALISYARHQKILSAEKDNRTEKDKSSHGK